MKTIALFIGIGLSAVGSLGSSALCFAQSAELQKVTSEPSTPAGQPLVTGDSPQIAASMARESGEMTAPAKAGKTQQNGLTASGLSPSRSIGKVALALIVVVGLIFAVAALLKRAGLSSLNRGKQLVLRESLSVGAKERLVVVDFAGESLLLGVASGKVSLVKSVPLLGVDSSDLPAAHLGARNPLDFQHKLNEFLLKGQK
ncbi:MAG TPA: flagellar biosynthetic protein FliO [Marinagarivorans sp.]